MPSRATWSQAEPPRFLRGHAEHTASPSSLVVTIAAWTGSPSHSTYTVCGLPGSSAAKRLATKPVAIGTMGAERAPRSRARSMMRETAASAVEGALDAHLTEGANLEDADMSAFRRMVMHACRTLPPSAPAGSAKKKACAPSSAPSGRDRVCSASTTEPPSWGVYCRKLCCRVRPRGKASSMHAPPVVCRMTCVAGKGAQRAAAVAAAAAAPPAGAVTDAAASPGPAASSSASVPVKAGSSRRPQ